MHSLFAALPGAFAVSRWIAPALMVVFAGIVVAGCAGQPEPGEGPSLRGLSPLSAELCWASGEGGLVLRTTDGGATWQRHRVAAANGADLRDIHAFDADRAVVMATTEPALLLRTADGGRSWVEVYRHRDPAAFFDTVAFWDGDDADRGVAFGDPIDGAFLWLETEDRGRTWQSAPGPLPRPLDGEGGFAASGTMVCTVAGGGVWVGTSQYGRLLHRGSWEGPWTYRVSPLRAGLTTAGVFSVAVRADGRGLAVGGQYDAPEERLGTAAYTTDGGATWMTPMEYPGGYRSAVAWAPDGSLAVAVGPGGTDLTRDGGRHWQPLPGPGWHAVGFAGDGSCWVAGSDGRIQPLALP